MKNFTWSFLEHFVPNKPLTTTKIRRIVAWTLDKRNGKQSRITFYGVVGIEKFKKNDKIK